MFDWAEYLARRTCSHVIESYGGSNSPQGRSLVNENLFVYDPATKSFKIFKGYNLEVEDLNPAIRFTLGSFHQQISIPGDLVDNLRSLKVSPNYRDILNSIRTSPISEKGKIVEVQFNINPKRSDNTAGRTQNKDRLFHSLHNCVTKPILTAIINSG